MEPFKDPYGILELVASGKLNNDDEYSDEIEAFPAEHKIASKPQIFICKLSYSY